MTHSPHRVVRNRTWLAGILLGHALLCCPVAGAQQAIEAPDTTSDTLCPNASSQLSINLCFSDLVDQQKRRIQVRLAGLNSQVDKRLETAQLLVQFNAFQITLCANYPRLFHGSALGTGSRLYCEYDLNNAFLDQLRNLEDQARGRHGK